MQPAKQTEDALGPLQRHLLADVLVKPDKACRSHHHILTLQSKRAQKYNFFSGSDMCCHSCQARAPALALGLAHESCGELGGRRRSRCRLRPVAAAQGGQVGSLEAENSSEHAVHRATNVAGR